MTDPRRDLLATHLLRQGLTTHELATALAVNVVHVRAALAGLGWFGPATERRMCEFLEVAKTEWGPLG